MKRMMFRIAIAVSLLVLSSVACVNNSVDQTSAVAINNSENGGEAVAIAGTDAVTMDVYIDEPSNWKNKDLTFISMAEISHGGFSLERQGSGFIYINTTEESIVSGTLYTYHFIEVDSSNRKYYIKCKYDEDAVLRSYTCGNAVATIIKKE